MKTPPLQVFDFDFAFARFDGVIGEVALDVGEGFSVRIADDRHDQPALGADGDADVEVMVLHEVVAVHAPIDRGDRL